MNPTLQLVQVVFQALGSLGIAGGLIYTAIQFRNYRRAQHFANFGKLVELQMHLREMRVNDPSLAQVYRHDVETARNDEEVRQYFFNLMQLSVFEVVWFGYQAEQVPESYFRSWDSRMRAIASEPSFRTMFNSQSMKIMHDEFHAYMRQMVDSTPERRVSEKGPQA